MINEKIISIILRIAYIAITSTFAALFGVAVAMGFDSGFSLLPSIIALLYFFTVIPAILLGFVPLKTILSPPYFLKIWYYWIAVLVAIYVIFISIIRIKAITSSLHADPFGTVCIHQKATDANDKVWIEIASQNFGFEKSPRVPMEANEVRCSNFTTKAISPIQIRAYDATNSESALTPTFEVKLQPFEVKLQPNKTVCLGVYPNQSQAPQWDIKNESCDSHSFIPLGHAEQQSN